MSHRDARLEKHPFKLVVSIWFLREIRGAQRKLFQKDRSLQAR